MTPRAISSLPTWLHMLAQVYPPQSLALVGAGNGTGPVVQWLQNHAIQAEKGAPAVTLLEPHAPSMAQLAKRLAATEACAEWRLLPDLLAPAHGEHTYYQFTLAAENGLLHPEALSSLWPSLRLQSQQPSESVSLASLLPASWLLVDCLPAAVLLQDTHLPALTQVVLARVMFSNEAQNGASLTEVQAVLADSGFKVIATFSERNCALGKALLVRDSLQLQSQLDQTRQSLEVETQDRVAEQKAKDQVLAGMQHRYDELTKAIEEETKAKAELQSQLDQTRQSLEVENSALKKDFCSIQSKLLQKETLLQTTLTICSDLHTQLRFNSKSDGIYKNKQGLVKYDLPGNTPAYLVSNEAGDFDIAPKFNSLRLEPNKAYEFSGTVIFEGTIQPVVWLFEYDQHNKKINSNSFPTQNGEFRTFFKTQANATTYAIGIRLAGSGSLNPQNTGFKFENSLAIEVAEAMQHSNAGFDKKLMELQSKLQKEQQSQNQNSLRQIEAFLRLQNYCGDRMVLPDMHGWPVSPDLGVYIIRLVERGGFDAIVEFGSGVSTQLIALALQKAAGEPNNSISTPFVSFEHLEAYLQQTQAQLHQAQLSESVELVYAPLIETSGPQNKPSLYYDCKDTLQQLRQSITKPKPKLLVFVDGPPAATGPLARFPAMQAIEQAFEGRAEVHYLMDDYIRQDERDIVDQWEAHLEQQGRQVEKQELKQFEKQACLLITKSRS